MTCKLSFDFSEVKKIRTLEALSHAVAHTVSVTSRGTGVIIHIERT